MSVKSLKTGTRSISMLAGNTPEHHVLIAESTVGSGGAASITFSNIPADYQHLQVRCILRTINDVGTTFTTNSGTFARRHYLYGDGSSAVSGADTTNFMTLNWGGSTIANTFGVSIVDILDYASTTKNITMRSLTGRDANGSGVIGLYSQLYTSSSAITSITISAASGNLAQYSTVALYGIK